MSDLGTCDGCGLLRKLTSTGVVALHYIRVPSYQRNTLKVRKTRQACPGSNRPPRRVEP